MAISFSRASGKILGCICLISLSLGRPRIITYSMNCRPSVLPGNRGLSEMNSAKIHPNAQMSILLVYRGFPKISSGAL
jgi:hypothetical protein